MQIDLNCDCGESFGAWTKGEDTAILPHVSSTNIACGGHAGDPITMRATVRLAKLHGTAIGAHPGFPDLQGFGRRFVDLTPAEVSAHLLAQVGALAAIATAEGLSLTHVKPHGALYNHAARTPSWAQAIAATVAAFRADLILVGLAGSELITAGRAAGLQVAEEAFADRAYEADGSLRSRSQPGALLEDDADVLRQVINILHGFVLTPGGKQLPLKADTICLHGDTPGAGQRARMLATELPRAGITVVALRHPSLSTAPELPHGRTDDEIHAS
ncbi:MAG: 5-oxoprolinase subunit PxpA [Herpetosiphon sp.]